MTLELGEEIVTKIKDMVVGTTITADLLVKAADTPLTRTQKPYLRAELSDGSESLQAVDWDWGSSPAPEKGSIVSVTAEVSEYAGKKQLKLKTLRHNPDADVSAFVPNGNFELQEYLSKAKLLIDEIRHATIREIVRDCFNENATLWKTIPAAKGNHHAFLAGNLKHSVDVALKARAIAHLVPGANIDLCIAGGLLQDLGKLWTYKFEGPLIEMTEEGVLLDHIAMGIAYLEHFKTIHDKKVVMLLQHLISSHHGKVEYGSPTTPQFIEAWIVATADSIDAKVQTILELNSKAKPGDKFTERSYTLENRAMLTQQYIAEILGG